MLSKPRAPLSSHTYMCKRTHTHTQAPPRRPPWQRPAIPGKVPDCVCQALSVQPPLPAGKSQLTAPGHEEAWGPWEALPPIAPVTGGPETPDKWGEALSPGVHSLPSSPWLNPLPTPRSPSGRTTGHGAASSQLLSAPTAPKGWPSRTRAPQSGRGTRERRLRGEKWSLASLTCLSPRGAVVEESAATLEGRVTRKAEKRRHDGATLASRVVSCGQVCGLVRSFSLACFAKCTRL